jgi:hypothetical protein
MVGNIIVAVVPGQILILGVAASYFHRHHPKNALRACLIGRPEFRAIHSPALHLDIADAIDRPAEYVQAKR